MAMPEQKSIQVERQMESVTKSWWGRSRIESIENDICVCCGSGATKFKDEISKKEFTISGFCQGCQNKTFK